MLATVEERGIATPSPPQAQAPTLLEQLHAFCFPGGEEQARLIHAIKTIEAGRIRMSPGARWIPLTAEQLIESTCSNFRWVARLDPGKFTSVTVTDAYEEARGNLTIKLGGVLPVKKFAGQDVDRAHLQRYLAAVMVCPPTLLNHVSLQCIAVGPHTLRIGDTQDQTGATIDLDISKQGCPIGIRAIRPRLVGKQAVATRWFATATDFREWEGLHIPTRLDVSWQLPEGSFTYYRSEITSFQALR